MLGVIRTLNISEIFYSLQGEGARAGTPTIFVRLQGCKTKHACQASGVQCDTEFESGKSVLTTDLLAMLARFPCKEITWTGGEPLDQLTEEIVAEFKAAGYFQAVETSGNKPAPPGLDFICVSPKVAEHVVAKNFPDGVTELRYVRHSGQSIPQPAIKAQHLWISPHSDGASLNRENIRHCVALCLENPAWRLSVQQHKIWGVL